MTAGRKREAVLRLLRGEPLELVARKLGVTSPAFVRASEGNGCAERFIRTLKENLLWVRTFRTVEELRLALIEFRRTYNDVAPSQAISFWKSRDMCGHGMRATRRSTGCGPRSAKLTMDTES